MTLENRGIPTVVICTEPFVNSANVQARSFGRAGFQAVTIPHPLGGIAPALVEQHALAAYDEVVKVLTNPLPHQPAGN